MSSEGKRRWYSCEDCHGGQPPGARYVGAGCAHCGGGVVEVAPVAPNLSQARDRSDPEAQRRRAEMEASLKAIEEEER